MSRSGLIWPSARVQRRRIVAQKRAASRLGWLVGFLMAPCVFPPATRTPKLEEFN